MQHIAPPTHRLSWFPVHPSWIVAIGLSLVAVLPHQTPLPIYRALRSRIGAMLFAALSIYVFWNIPVLGMAMMIFLVSLQLNTYVENFVPNILSKEKITNKRKWLQEEILMEEPESIQDRTDSPGILIDEVTGDSKRWFVESAMGESPIAIQERPVGSLYAQDSSNSEQEGPSHK
jgi:hypothetical protein